ncbi:hypothetical protein CGMCC3_g828 [Colletotrichum fructicola]|nr:uncharacterized protein CGMCC3_g828 [Colletotrichum fructicola]KAE9582964.1 hypothetical protein CGMCC3_g828 [Colletotrichum fructicola]
MEHCAAVCGRANRNLRNLWTGEPVVPWVRYVPRVVDLPAAPELADGTAVGRPLAYLSRAPAASADESRRNERQAAPGSPHTVLATEEWSQASGRDEGRGLPLSTGDPFVDGLHNSWHSVEDPRAAVIDDPDRRTFPAP